VSNKITGIDGNRAAPVGPGRAVERVRDVVTSPKEGGAEEAGSVAITGTARQLAELEQALASQPAVDEARVASIRAAIEQGSYTVSPDRIADQLLLLERALGHLKG
jgi:negative regulator of flagellin synthesis FlgM